MEKEKKSLNGLIMVIGLALLIGLAGAGGWLLGGKFANEEDKIINGDTNPSKETVSVLPINDSVKEKITKIVNAASDYKNDTLKEFDDGVSTIPEVVKFKVTMNLLANEEKMQRYSMGTSIPINMDELDDYTTGAEANVKAGANGTLKLSDFESMYKYIFNEDVQFKVESDNFFYYCPSPLAYSKKNDTIYLFDACGGTYIPWTIDIIDISSDETYYYAKVLYVRVLMGSEMYQERYILNWKFDKNVALLGTERQNITNN